MRLLLTFLMFAATAVHAQRPVYQCNGVYTDQPCAGGREVDIAPTRGAHSMSGARKESLEAQMDQINRNSQVATQKGMEQANRLMRCHGLMLERQTIDRGGQERKDRRFAIRQEQFRLSCERT